MRWPHVRLFRSGEGSDEHFRRPAVLAHQQPTVFLRAGFRVGYLSWRGVMETTLYSRSLLSTSSTCSSILSF